jgi:hypothetical protein
MKTLLIICAGLFLSGNGMADPVTDAVKKAIKIGNDNVERTNDYLSTVEQLDLENSDYRNDMVLFDTFTDDRPSIGEVVKVFSGDRMMSQRIGMVVPCIIPKETWSRIIRFAGTFEIKENREVCRDIFLKRAYIGDYPLMVGYSGPYQPWVVVNEKKGKYKFGVGDANGQHWIKKKAIEGKDFEFTKAFKSIPDSLQKQIEYLGRSGSTLAFVYSESKGGYAKDVVFNREFSVDLNEGNIGGFKGAIFEVLEATNFEIAYKIKRHFP